jgi:hypothetical protein
VTVAATATVTGLFLPIKDVNATAPEASLVVQPELSRELGRPAKQRPVTVTVAVAFTVEMALSASSFTYLYSSAKFGEGTEGYLLGVGLLWVCLQ